MDTKHAPGTNQQEFMSVGIGEIRQKYGNQIIPSLRVYILTGVKDALAMYLFLRAEKKELPFIATATRASENMAEQKIKTIHAIKEYIAAALPNVKELKISIIHDSDKAGRDGLQKMGEIWNSEKIREIPNMIVPVHHKDIGEAWLAAADGERKSKGILPDFEKIEKIEKIEDWQIIMATLPSRRQSERGTRSTRGYSYHIRWSIRG